MASPQPLRGRLQHMTERLLSLEKTVCAEAKRKKEAAEKEIQSIAVGVNRIEQSLTHEIQKRVNSARTAEQTGRQLIESTAERVDEKVEECLESITENIDNLVKSLEAFEQNVGKLSAIVNTDRTGDDQRDIGRVALASDAANQQQQSCSSSSLGHNTQCPKQLGTQDSLEENAAFICSNMTRLQKKLQNIKSQTLVMSSEFTVDVLKEIDDEHRKMILKLRDVKRFLNAQLNDGLHEFQQKMDKIREDTENYQKETEELTSVYKLYIPQEMQTFQQAFKAEAEAREETDDDVVVALNNYNAALQKGFFTIVNDL